MMLHYKDELLTSLVSRPSFQKKKKKKGGTVQYGSMTGPFNQN